MTASVGVAVVVVVVGIVVVAGEFVGSVAAAEVVPAFVGGHVGKVVKERIHTNDPSTRKD